MFAKYSKSFEDIEKDIPFAAMVIKLQFVMISVQFLKVWEDGRLGTHLYKEGLNITHET